MKQGDFSELAKHYKNRPGYSPTALKLILNYFQKPIEEVSIADVGAGTGKFLNELLQIGCKNIRAVEPNDAMRAEGEAGTEGTNVKWSKGSGEETGLEDNTYDWVIMASSFHWTDPKVSLPEFKRLLKPGGLFTAVWNPRDLESNAFQQSIDQMIRDLVPNLKRVSSGSKEFTKNLNQTLLEGGHFEDLFFIEAPHIIEMDKERYLNVWRSVNDIQAQAGEEIFAKIMKTIEERIADMETVPVSYNTRAWSVSVVK